MSLQRIHCGPRMSQAVIHNKTVYVAGQVAENARGTGVAQQTREILSSIDALLSQAGTDKKHLLSATIWPARATVLSPQLAGPEYKIEIAVIAAQP